jgi:hypothetical protein
MSVLFPSGFSDQNFLCISHLSHACYMPRPCHPSCIYRYNNTLWRVKVMKLLIMQSSPPCRHVLPLMTKYSPQHPVLVYVAYFSWETKLKCIQNNSQNYTFYILISKFKVSIWECRRFWVQAQLYLNLSYIQKNDMTPTTS